MGVWARGEERRGEGETNTETNTETERGREGGARLERDRARGGEREEGYREREEVLIDGLARRSNIYKRRQTWVHNHPMKKREEFGSSSSVCV